jgi:hypothetical protein
MGCRLFSREHDEALDYGLAVRAGVEKCDEPEEELEEELDPTGQHGNLPHLEIRIRAGTYDLDRASEYGVIRGLDYLHVAGPCFAGLKLRGSRTGPTVLTGAQIEISDQLIPEVRRTIQVPISLEDLVFSAETEDKVFDGEKEIWAACTGGLDISCDSSPVVARRCTFERCMTGVRVGLGATLCLEDCVVQGNFSDGVFASLRAQVTIRGAASRFRENIGNDLRAYSTGKIRMVGLGASLEEAEAVLFSGVAPKVCLEKGGTVEFFER